MEININEIVKVKLTEHGTEILKKYHGKYGFPPLQKPDAEGFYEFQIWEMMHIFGESIYNGAKQVILNNTLFYIPENNPPEGDIDFSGTYC